MSPVMADIEGLVTFRGWGVGRGDVLIGMIHARETVHVLAYGSLEILRPADLGGEEGEQRSCKEKSGPGHVIKSLYALQI